MSGGKLHKLARGIGAFARREKQVVIRCKTTLLLATNNSSEKL
jgi:hypothetical protein